MGCIAHYSGLLSPFCPVVEANGFGQVGPNRYLYRLGDLGGSQDFLFGRADNRDGRLAGAGLNELT